MNTFVVAIAIATLVSVLMSLLGAPDCVISVVVIVILCGGNTAQYDGRRQCEGQRRNPR